MSILERSRLRLLRLSRFSDYVYDLADDGTLTISRLEKLADDLDLSQLTMEARTDPKLTVAVDALRKHIESPDLPRGEALAVVWSVLEICRRVKIERNITSIETRPLPNLQNGAKTMKCFACAHGLTACTPVYVPMAAASGDVLGVCWECHVLGCYEHAERDAASGKWNCFPSIANALLQSAQQLATGATTSALQAGQPFTSSRDFDVRFPSLSNASRSSRLKFKERRSDLVSNFGLRFQPRNDAAVELLGDALGVAEFVVYGTEESRPTYMGPDELRPSDAMATAVANTVLTRDLAERLLRMRNG